MSLCTPGHRHACWTAKSEPERCRCACGGANHGTLRFTPHRQEELFEPEVPEWIREIDRALQTEETTDGDPEREG